MGILATAAAIIASSSPVAAGLPVANAQALQGSPLSAPEICCEVYLPHKSLVDIESSFGDSPLGLSSNIDLDGLNGIQPAPFLKVDDSVIFSSSEPSLAGLRSALFYQPSDIGPENEAGLKTPDEENPASETEPAPQEELSPENVILVTGVERDVVDSFSLETFDVAQDLDRAVIAPVASFYDDVLPDPIRIAGRNFLSNLNEPVNFINFLLQFKIGKAIETAGRFAINSSLGIGGLIDIAAKPGINLPLRRNGFANTMGFYGIKPGRYLYLPFIGPTTTRDLIGTTLDRLIVPVIFGPPVNDPIFGPAAGIATALDLRIENDERIRELQEENNDPYSSIRDDYLELRKREIDALRGRTSTTVTLPAAAPPSTVAPAAQKAQPTPSVPQGTADQSATTPVVASPPEETKDVEVNPTIIFVPTPQ